MESPSAVEPPRWWERAAQEAALELPASLAELPVWLFLEGETRRLTVGPAVRGATVGAGWTGRVLLDAVAGHVPLAPDVLSELMDHALEGPLWLDVGPRGAALEGGIFTWTGGLERWTETVSQAAAGALGGIDPLGAIAEAGARLPGGRVAGAVLQIAPSVGIAALVQLTVRPGEAHLWEGLAAVAQRLGIPAADVSLAERWGQQLAAAGARVLDVEIAAAGPAALSLRWWNASEEVALALLEEAGADGDARARFQRLRAWSGREDVARVVLSLRADGPPRPRWVLDMGLVVS